MALRERLLHPRAVDFALRSPKYSSAAQIAKQGDGVVPRRRSMVKAGLPWILRRKDAFPEGVRSGDDVSAVVPFNEAGSTMDVVAFQFLGHDA
jgi:hypothetical protein